MSKEYKIKTLSSGKKRYMFDVNLGYNPDGSRNRTTVTAESVTDGRKKVAQLLLGQNVIKANKSDTFEELFAYYLKSLENQNKSPNTIRNKKAYYKYFKPFYKDKVTKLSITKIYKWQNTLKLNNQSKNKIENELKAYINWLYKNDFIKENITRKMTLTTFEKKKVNFITEDQFKYLLNYIDDDFKLFFITLFYTGLRLGEILGLQYKDIQGTNLVLSHVLKMPNGKPYLSTTFKTPKSKRVVPIPIWLELGSGEGRIFIKSRDHYRKELNRALEAANMLHMTIHDFRHSYASMMINKKIDQFTLMELLGHDNITTTMNTYGHLYDDKRQEVTNSFGTKM